MGGPQHDGRGLDLAGGLSPWLHGRRRGCCHGLPSAPV